MIDTGERGAQTILELESMSREERIERLREVGDPGVLLLELADVSERMAIDDLAHALLTTEMLTHLADVVEEGLARIRTRRARAQALAYATRFDDALAVLDEAFAIAVAEDAPLEAARIRMTRLHALAKQGRYAEAVREGDAARENFVAHGEAELAARADINLGVTHRMRDDPATAVVHLQRARPVVLDQPVILAQLDSNLGEALLDLYRFAEAERAFHDALDVFTDRDMTRARAIVEGNLADLMSRQGRLDSALYHFECARRLLEGDAPAGEPARLIAEQADALAAVGLFTEAAATYRQAIPALDEAGLTWDLARARAGLGRVLIELGRLGPAEESLNAAEAAFTRLDHSTGRTRVRLLLGQLAQHTGNVDLARQHFVTVLKDTEAATTESALAHLHLARIALETGNRLAAASMLHSAESVAQQFGLQPMLVEVLHLRSQLHRLSGQSTAALEDLRAAADLVEHQRGRFASAWSRSGFFRSRQVIFADLVRTLLNEDGVADLAEAFHAAERGRGRTLLDTINGLIELTASVRSGADDPAEQVLLDRMLEIEGRLNALHLRSDPLAKSAPAVAPGAELRETIRDLEEQLRVLEGRLAAGSLPLGHVVAPPVTARDLQADLSPSTAVIEYFMTPEELLAFVIRSDRIEVARGLADVETVVERVERFRFQISRAISRIAQAGSLDATLLDDTITELQHLHAMLMKPLQEYLDDATRLVVVPHGVLHLIPFHALHDGDRFAIESGELVQTPSASVLHHLSRRAPREPATASVRRSLIVSVASQGSPGLEREAAAVASMLDPNVWLREEQATIEHVREQMREADLVHFACHGRFSRLAPRSSGLRLSDDWLTLRDAYTMRTNGAFVVLSGCETGAASADEGDELMGLAYGLIAAGAGGLVASLWTIGDESTAEMIESFYQLWENRGHHRGAAAAALREAQLAIMRKHPHPVYWAPFITLSAP
jgi:CHAT domain-containing protein/tetratricopeptide (TPR) repeat protein